MPASWQWRERAMSWQVEALAAALALVNAVLVARRSLWNYAFGIGAVTLFLFIFAASRLYAAAGLQLVFLALNLYGLWNWRRARAETGGVPIGRMAASQRLATMAAVVALAALLALVLGRLTDAAMPAWDSANTALALAAQYWQARRRLEAWPLWCLVNIGSTGLYAAQGLWITAGTYAGLLLVALWGWRQWWLVEKVE